MLVNENPFNLPSQLQRLQHKSFDAFAIQVYIKRDDLIHQEISGNKWRKLKYYYQEWKTGDYNGILTMGGAYSNHVAATAALGKLFNIPTKAIIRGEELHSRSNHTLREATQSGMELIFVSRSKYRSLGSTNGGMELQQEFPRYLIIPEGGAGALGILGCQEILTEIIPAPEYIITAMGTGTTAAGLLSSGGITSVIGVPVIKNGGYLRNTIEPYLLAMESPKGISELTLWEDYHFGGYANVTKELKDFISWFESDFNIQLDPIYTGKMVYAFWEKLNQGYFPLNSQLVLLHTGGLQGRMPLLGGC